MKLPFESEYADSIAAIHVIEHFYQWDAIEALKEWNRVLKTGGKLVLELPCMDKVLKYIYMCIKKGINLSPMMGFHVFWGDPKYRDPLMVHKWGYTQAMIKEALEFVGFNGVIFEEPRYHFPVRDMRVLAWK